MSKMISKEKMFWSFNTFYPLVLWGNVENLYVDIGG